MLLGTSRLLCAKRFDRSDIILPTAAVRLLWCTNIHKFTPNEDLGCGVGVDWFAQHFPFFFTKMQLIFLTFLGFFWLNGRFIMLIFVSKNNFFIFNM